MVDFDSGYNQRKRHIRSFIHLFVISKPRIRLSSSCLSSFADDLSERRGETLFMLEDLIQTESTTKIGDNLDAGEAMTFFMA